LALSAHDVEKFKNKQNKIDDRIDHCHHLCGIIGGWFGYKNILKLILYASSKTQGFYHRLGGRSDLTCTIVVYLLRMRVAR